MVNDFPTLLGPDDVVVRVSIFGTDPADTSARLVAAKWGLDALGDDVETKVAFLDVHKLDDRERFAYARWMGIGCSATTFDEIGAELGISRAAAQALFARAANKTTRHKAPEGPTVPVGE